VLEWAVHHAGGVDHLEAQVFVFRVPDVQGLSCERIGLHFNIRTGNTVHKTRLSNIRISSHQNRPLKRINRRQPRQMLPDFLQIRQRRADFLYYRAHPAQRSFFQRLTPIKRVSVFSQLQVVLGQVLSHILGGLDVPECQLVVIFVIQHVDKVAVERMDLFDLGELLEDAGQLLADGVLAEFYLG
jgi:hypothetical protein